MDCAGDGQGIAVHMHRMSQFGSHACRWIDRGVFTSAAWAEYVLHTNLLTRRRRPAVVLL